MDELPIGRRVADQISLWTPATGPLWRDWAISRYLIALSLLSKAGVVPAAALDACRGLAGNVILDEKFDKAADLAREHNLSIPDALSRAGVLSSAITGTATVRQRESDAVLEAGREV